jgi:hypothetical protein
MAGSTATQGTVAGRPQPQTTAEPAGGPFVRHAPDGRRAMYVASSSNQGTQNAQFIANPMVSSPGWNKGYRVVVQTSSSATTSGTNTLYSADSPWNFLQLIQMKDAFGTQLLTGPGFDIAYLVPYYSGQFGTDLMRNPAASPQFYPPINTTTSTIGGNFQFPTYFPFEFAKGYGVISGANAALLPVLQMNLTAITSVINAAAGYSTYPTSTVTVDSDFYWLPNVPADPPGIGTTCQWIYQQCNPTIASGTSQIVQLPRLGGYLTGLILDLRNANGNRLSEGVASGGPGFVVGSQQALDASVGWPARPKIIVDGVPLIDTLIGTLLEDMAINSGIGAYGNQVMTTATAATTANTNPIALGGATIGNYGEQGTGAISNPRPLGTLWISRKTSLAQRDFGLLDTGEIFLSTNPGTQIEVAGYPWGTVTTGPAQLNAVVGQIVPSGALVRGLPEA